MAPDLRRRVLPLLLCSVLAACGSTVKTNGSLVQGGNTPGGSTDSLGNPVDTLGQDGGSSGGTAPGSGGASGSTGSITGTSSGGGGSSSGGSAGGSQNGSGSTSTSNGSPTGGGNGTTRNPGVTATQIKVGLINLVNGDALNSAAGASGITSGDTKANDNAIIKDINAHGGIAGRKLVAEYADFDSTSTQTLDQQYAALCQRFTRDTPVFAVVGGANESYRKCIAKAGIVYLDDDLPTLGAAAFQMYPGLIELGYANLDRLAAYQVTSLQEQSYFTPWDTINNAPAKTGKAKVGILTYNDKVFSHAVDTFLVPGLKRLGYTPLVEKVAQVNTAGDYGGQAAAVKSAQLAFASNGVTHVISFEGNGGLSLFFLPTAKSQAYYPRYGINSASGFQALKDTGVADGDQLHGAIGFGWIPSLDMPDKYNPDNGPYSNTEKRRCLAIFKANGITFSSSNAASIGLSACAVLTLLKKTLDPIPTQVTFTSFVNRVGTLGTTFQPAGSLGVDLRADRHDGSSKAYHWHYFSDCDCFHYEGALQTIP